MVLRKDDNDLLRRMKRLEALMVVFMASDRFEDDGEGDYFLKRFFDQRERYDDDFSFLVRDLFYRGRGFPRGQLSRDVRENSARLDQLSEKADKALDLVNQISSLNNKESLASRLEELSHELSALSEETGEIRREVHEKFLIDTMGLSGSRVKQTRFIPMRVYISEDDPQTVSKVERAALNLIERLGFLTATEFPPEKGSWFRKWISKSSDALTSDEVKDVMKKGKRAVELATIDKKRAEVNKENAIAAAEFIKAIENVPKAVAQFGSLLIIKGCGADGECNIFTRVLSEREMEYIENNQNIMKDANHVLDKLASIKIDKDTTIRIDNEKGV